MISLRNITLVALGSKDVEGMIKALQYSCQGVRWGAVKLITDESSMTWISPEDKMQNSIQVIKRERINSIDEWNKAIVYDLGDYIDTEFALLIHPDGFVVNPSSWKDEFFKYDYIGAPWPEPTDDFSYRTPEGELVRVGNSVSLRSKKLMQLPKKLGLEWKEYFGNTNEDGFICVHNRKILEENGCIFADIDVAKYFSHETMIPEVEGIVPFAFHRHHGTNAGYPNFES